jgi:hypothetical protein
VERPPGERIERHFEERFGYTELVRIAYLKKSGLERGQYKQIANYVMAQSEINVAIGNKPPKVYFAQLLEQCNGRNGRYGNIADLDALHQNLRMNCIPDDVASMSAEDYPAFLAARRALMAQKIETYFAGL